MKNLRSFLAGMITMLVVMALIGTVFAANKRITKELVYKDIKVSLDGELLELKDASGDPVEPFMFDGTNYLPVRAVSEALGLEVSWDGETSTVILTTPQARRPTYITQYGKRWHYDPHCNGGDYWEVPYSTAEGMGLTPCDKCVLKEG